MRIAGAIGTEPCVVLSAAMNPIKLWIVVSPRGEEIRRRRECLECGRRFTTRERVETTVPRIIKRDERREEYDRRKLLLGIERACQKRPISTESIERILDRIERGLQETGEKEVPVMHWVNARWTNSPRSIL